MNRRELEVVAEFIEERNEARARVAVLQDACETSSATIRILNERIAEIVKERDELLAEKSALTFRIVELQTAVTSAGIKVPHKRRRKA